MSLPRLLVFNLATDSDDPILGFGVEWVRALAARAVCVDVVCMTAGRFELPDNVAVYSVGKERGLNEAQRAIQFYRILGRLLQRRRPDACFVHMAPVFAVMGAPLLRARRVPVTMWYTHAGVPPLLAVAARLVDTVVTASPESFGARARRVVVTGHGVATALYSPSGTAARRPVRILSVGRVAPVKRLELLIDAVTTLVHETGEHGLEVRIVGPVTELDRPYAERLARRAHEQIPGVVNFVGPMPPAAVVQEYRDATVMVNLTGRGSFDKAALEAMACGVPVVTATPELAQLEPTLYAPGDDAEGVARSIGDVLARSASDREELGGRLREFVVARHSLDRLADLLVDDLLVLSVPGQSHR